MASSLTPAEQFDPKERILKLSFCDVNQHRLFAEQFDPKERILKHTLTFAGTRARAAEQFDPKERILKHPPSTDLIMYV